LISQRCSIRSSLSITGFFTFLLFLSIFIFTRFSFLKPICCWVISVLMGPTEIPSQSTETIKIPTAHYEFGSTFIDHPRVIWASLKWPFSFLFFFWCFFIDDSILQLLLWGRILTDGRLNARVKWDLAENLTFKANAQVRV